MNLAAELHHCYDAVEQMKAEISACIADLFSDCEPADLDNMKASLKHYQDRLIAATDAFRNGNCPEM